MEKNKRTYYITLGTGEISSVGTASPWNFKIEASPDEIKLLRSYFDQTEAIGWQNFIRAHIPFKLYHEDKENDAYDDTMQKIYKLIYDLGDEEAKSHIASLGVLDGGDGRS